jgi:hypothetical protein
MRRRSSGSLVLAAGILAGWAVAAGCAGGRYVDRVLYGPTGKPAVHDDPMVLPDLGPDDFSDAALAGAPSGVRTAFRQDHTAGGPVAVTSVRQHLLSDGLIVYEVTYVDDGDAHRTVYLADGTDVSTTYEPGTAVARSAPRDAVERNRREAAARWLAAAPAPTTRPTTRPATQPIE